MKGQCDWSRVNSAWHGVVRRQGEAGRGQTIQGLRDSVKDRSCRVLYTIIKMLPFTLSELVES